VLPGLVRRFRTHAGAPIWFFKWAEARLSSETLRKLPTACWRSGGKSLGTRLLPYSNVIILYLSVGGLWSAAKVARAGTPELTFQMERYG
jgi:hypothetical protein